MNSKTNKQTPKLTNITKTNIFKGKKNKQRPEQTNMKIKNKKTKKTNIKTYIENLSGYIFLIKNIFVLQNCLQ